MEEEAKRAVIQCLPCGTSIYSRARHDYRSCECGKVSIDGGGDYTKICGEPDDIRNYGLQGVGVTERELYIDWNLGIDVLGKFTSGAVIRPTVEQWREMAWEKWSKKTMKGAK
jgi:hypothetical protein